MRKIILAVLGLLFIFGAIALGNYFIEKNQKPKNKCCFKYKKKGVNCKRCPKLLEELSFKRVS